MINIISNIVKHISFRLVSLNDAEFILSLRVDESKNKHLSSVENDLNAQKEWIESYKKREKNNLEYYYIIVIGKEKLGAVRLYDFKGDSFSWGSWILKKGAPPYAAIESALLVYEIAFYKLGFKRSHFDVRKGNKKVVDFHSRFGGNIVSEDELNYYFNITKETYENTKKRYKKFLTERKDSET